MSRRGNCHDNAVAESFFQLLKRERIKEKIYGTRDEARSDIFDYIEMFYNSRRRHGSSEQMPPAEYENLYHQRLRSVRLSVVIHRYAHLAPNHLTEHARKIDDIFGDDVPNMSHMENKEEIKKRNTLIYKWRALQDSNLRPTA